ncbi:GFA family protein [Thalassotalea euphylliae]|uniref:GFA family protein n=1 Tax=Thalassotalea euphylliae TaxID=1655234 RepID=UPI003626595F
MNKGSCLCGKVRFSVAKFEPLLGHCHCKMCRKFHGAAFSTFGEVRLENLAWDSGKSELKHYKADNGSIRSFCKHCGSSILFESTFNRDNKTIEIALAAFDELEPVEPDAHIYLDSKVPWLEVNDSLKKNQGYRES